MRSRLFFMVFFVGFLAKAQECPNLLDPLNGATNVPITTSISWEAVAGVPSYIVSIGTAPNGTDIVNEQDVGNATTFTPPLGLPGNTEVFVTITLFFFDRPNIVCPSQSFTTQSITTVPDCTMLTDPQNGATGVNVGVNLLWQYAARASGYRITLGTGPGTGDIVNNLDLGNVLSYDSPTDFAPLTTIYVKILAYNNIGAAQNCTEESFTTRDLGDPPGCTQLTYPLDGAINVEISPILRWAAVPGATGYTLNIGRSPFANDILDGGIFFTNMASVINFETNSTIFVRIIPFNDAGEAQGCGQESFSTILGCGPFYDPNTGELITFFPELNFPDQTGICENKIPTRITTTDQADGFRWYRVLGTGEEVLLSEETFVDLFETGTYRYEAYNITNTNGVMLECPANKLFTVSLSAKATINKIHINRNGETFNVTAEVIGPGNYEFSVTASGGPYRDAPAFTDLLQGTYTLYVRDKNGCGVAEKEFKLGFPPPGFPKYFTPNGDGFHEFWNYVPPKVDPLQIKNIVI
ncbi:MAG: hypothetical protein ACPGQR_08260, partial [Marinirhabdus sp.]